MLRNFCLAVLCFCLLAAAGRAQEGRPAAAIPDFRLPADSFFRKDDANPQQRMVFAWFMVCIGPFNGGWEKTGVEEYVREIELAKSMGLDGFGLEMNSLGHSPFTLPAVEKMFQAAQQVGGFKLFFLFDGGEPDTFIQPVTEVIQQYAKHECYYRVNGQPLVGTYDRIKFNFVDALRQAGQEIFYVPTVWDEIQTGGTYLANPVNGMSRWEIQTSPLGGGLQRLEQQAAAAHAAGKAWMTTLAMHYWVGSCWSVPHWDWIAGQPPKAPKNGTYFEHAGGKGLEMQWRSVIETQKPEWVMMLTWNDYNESYIAPVDDYKKYPNGTAQAPLGWYKSLAGLDELNRYFIQWYKTGAAPAITSDSLFWSYRTSSQHLPAAQDPRAPVKIGNGPVGDDLYLTTALTAPACLQVSSGATTRLFQIPAGLHHTVTPFTPGAQTFALWRDGVPVLGAEGEPVVSALEYYNYHVATGFATVKSRR